MIRKEERIVEWLGEMRKGRRERIEKGSRERIEKEVSEMSSKTAIMSAKIWDHDLQISLRGCKSAVAVGRPDKKQYRCRTIDECEYEELHLRRGLVLVAITR